MRKITITIGIPAYNEQENISRLISLLLKQYLPKDVVLKKILVQSDGSTDNTIDKVKAIKNKKVKLRFFKKRQGIADSQNKIVKLSNSDILVLINADVLPKDKRFLYELVKPLLKNRNIGITGADVISLPARTLVEKVIADSHQIKHFIYKKIKNGNSVFLCHGRARAFSKSLYKTINWPKNCPEDAYSYLFCITSGFKFVFVPQAQVLFRSPANLVDHKRQSKRFFMGMKILEKYFGESEVKKEFYIPKSSLFKGMAEFILKHPLSAFGYFLISILVRTAKGNPNPAKWKMSLSSKKLLDESLNFTI